MLQYTKYLGCYIIFPAHNYIAIYIYINTKWQQLDTSK